MKRYFQNIVPHNRESIDKLRNCQKNYVLSGNHFAKRTFGSLALYHCGPLKIVVVVVAILPDFAFDVFTFFQQDFPAFIFRAFFVNKKATHCPLCIFCQKIVVFQNWRDEPAPAFLPGILDVFTFSGKFSRL